MKFKFLICFFTLVLFVAEGYEVSENVKKAQEAVVTIQVGTPDFPVGMGTGFVIEKNLLVTNFHVVANLREKKLFPVIKVKRSQNKESSPFPEIVKIKAMSALHDLAVLEISNYDGPVIPLSNDTKDTVENNSEVYILSSANDNFKLLRGQGFRSEDLRFTVSTNKYIRPGDSGASVVNSAGELTAIAHRGNHNLVHLTPVQYLKELLEEVHQNSLKDLQDEEIFDRAMKELKDLSDALVPQAQYELAYILYYYYSEPEKSKKLFERAAKQGHIDSHVQLGHIFQGEARSQGRGDLMVLAKHWSELVINDSPVAKYNLGNMYCSSCAYPGMSYDDTMAFSFMLAAAEENFAPAQDRVSDMYETGQGTLANRQQQLYWTERAAGNGNVRAKHKMAMAFRYGKMGIQPDIKKAFRLFTELESGGYIPSIKEKGLIHLYGFENIEPDLEKAFRRLIYAYSRGDASVIQSIEAMYKDVKDSENTNGKPHPSHIRFVELLEKNAEEEHLAAKLILLTLQGPEE